jgi:SAM-dependent methyltransferase
MAKIVVLASLYEPLEFLEAKIKNLNQAKMDGVEVFFSDCSSEETWAKVRDLISNNCKFTYRLDHYPIRRTLYWTWNWIIDQSNGATYFCNSNVDDITAPDYFQKMSKTLDEDPGVQIIASPWHTTHGKGQIWPPKFHNTTIPDLRNTCGHFPMWRASLHTVLGKFNAKMEAMGDAEFWYRIRKKFGIGSLRVHSEVLGCYLSHDKNLYAIADKGPDIDMLPEEMRPWPRGKRTATCHRCSGGQMKRAKKDNLNSAEYWDKTYSKETDGNHRRVDADRLAQLERWIRIRNYELGHFPFTLDVGCGLGEVEDHFRKVMNPARFVGVDIGPETVEWCRVNRGRAGVEFKVAPAETLPFEDGAFDVVWCGETIEHLEDPEKAIKEMARVLGEGGLLVLTTPYRGRNRDPEHLWEFEPDDIARWGNSIGELAFLDCRLLDGWISMFAVLRKASAGSLG